MNRSVAFCAVALVLAAAAAQAAVTVRAEVQPESAWTYQHRCHGHDEVNLVFAVRQKNMDSLQARLYEVSDPTHADYTDYMTLDQIGQLTRDDAALATVEEWLAPFASVVDRTVNGDFVTAKLAVAEAERMLNAEFHAYKHLDTGKVVFRASSYDMPEEVAAAVDFAARIVDFPARRSPRFAAIPQTAGAGKAGDAYPAVIQKYYNLPTTAPTKAGSAPAISLFEALGQDYSPSDLSKYQSSYGLPSNPIAKTIGPNSPFTCVFQPNSCSEASLDVQVASLALGLEMWYWSIKSTDETPFVDWAVAVANATTVPLVHSISYGGDAAEEPAALKTRFDQEVQKLGLRGVSVMIASGDDGVAGSGARSDPTKCGFNPSFPATIPHITAVGATMGPEAGQTEVACTSDKGGLITTGGGFSASFPRPQWQDAAVSAYLASTNVTMPPASMYNGTGRGYPDIAMMGHNYEIIVDGQVGVGSGTSASTPLFAAVVALVNNERQANGKKPLGFLNPALYQQAASNPSFINDVTSGKNNCAAGPVGHADCCQYGFEAAAGWDPVTGFGSVDYAKFAKVFAQL